MADQENNKMDDLFKSSLGNKSVKAPDGAWSGIAASMAAKKTSNRKFLWIGLAALLMLFTGFASFFCGYNYKNTNTVERLKIKHDTVIIYKTIEAKQSQDLNLGDSNPESVDEQLLAETNHLQSENSLLQSQIINQKNEVNSLKKALDAAVHKQQIQANNLNVKWVNSAGFNDRENSANENGDAFEQNKNISVLVARNTNLNGLNDLNLDVLEMKDSSAYLANLNKQLEDYLNSDSSKSFKGSTYLNFQYAQEFVKMSLLGYSAVIAPGLSETVTDQLAFTTGFGISHQFKPRFSINGSMLYGSRGGQVRDDLNNTRFYSSPEKNQWYSIDEQEQNAIFAQDSDLDNRQILSFTNLEGDLEDFSERVVGLDYPDSTVNIAEAYSRDYNSSKFITAYKIQHIELPVTLKYYPIIRKRLSMYLEFGGSALVFSSLRKTSELIELSTIQNTVQTNTQHFVIFNVISGLGFDYKFADRLAVGLTAQYKLGSKAKRHNYFSDAPRSLGINLGLRFRLY